MVADVLGDLDLGKLRVLLFIRTQNASGPSLIRAVTGAEERATSTLQTSSPPS